MYRVVEGEKFRTTWAEAPRVVVHSRGEDHVDLQMEFSSSAMDEVGKYRVTRLLFGHVFYYEWNHFEFHRFPHCEDDFEFALIEITDSPVVGQLLGSGRFMHPLPKHFRIGFDDHGTYDVVCGQMEASTYHVADA